MCGRFTLRTDPAVWAQQFLPGIDLDFSDIVPRYNIAPTQAIQCVLRPAVGQPRQLSALRWGLVPMWADDPAIGNRMINARSESVHEKNSFKQAFKQRRCLVPSDGYYEWKAEGKQKQPFHFHRPDQSVFAFAGLWERNKRCSAQGEELLTACLLTTAANDTTGAVHDRMPVIIMQDDWDRWLDPAFQDIDHLQQLLVPAPNDYLQYDPVNRYVNNARHEGPECLAPANPNS